MYCKYLKRFFDFLFSLMLLSVLSPLFVMTVILIALSLGRPIFFSQVRPGFREKLFTIYKFRTMQERVDERGDLLPDHMRLGGIGKFIRATSLDELPQLFNILRGEMSFVGPRPLLCEYLPLYNATQKRRHDVRPGITGWAQVNGRNKISWQQKFDFDVWYVDHCSLKTDLKIVLMTIIKVLKRSDITQEGHVSAEKFNGNA